MKTSEFLRATNRILLRQINENSLHEYEFCNDHNFRQMRPLRLLASGTKNLTVPLIFFIVMPKMAATVS